MEKTLVQSKTVWGGVLLAIEAAILSSGYQGLPWMQVIIAALGTFLTIYGFRDAMKK
jgi:hypothetical protein